MRYRKFGSLDWNVSALGFGIMRMPVIDGEYGRIDEEAGLKLVREAIDSGVNYLDTAWNYHGEGSEGFLGRVLADGYREKVRIATKMPCWLVEKPEDLDRYFDIQMERLQVDRIDFYLLHALQRDWWERMKEAGFRRWAEKKLADGVIGNLGFSFHGMFPLFRRIIEEYDLWTMTMVQHNYMDAEREAGTAGIRLAADKGLAVVAMEPLRGGQLAKEPPPGIGEIFRKAVPGRSIAEWGLRWLWDQSEISMVLSGMSAPEQVRENIRIACETGPGCMEDSEKEVIEAVKLAYEERAGIGCTFCGYCLPCPMGAAIPWIFEYYNISSMYDDIRRARGHYAMLDQSNRGDVCTSCGRCVEHCPQHLDIPSLLAECHSLLKPADPPV